MTWAARRARRSRHRACQDCTVATLASRLFRRVSWARSWQVSFPIGATSVRKTVGAAGFEPAILTLSHAYLSLPSGHCHSSAATAGGSHLAPSPHSNCWLAASLAAVEISSRLGSAKKPYTAGPRRFLGGCSAGFASSCPRRADNRVPCVTACDIRARMALGSAGVAVLPAGSLIPRAGGGGDDPDDDRAFAADPGLAAGARALATTPMADLEDDGH
jgi:hypothetical protein